MVRVSYFEFFCVTFLNFQSFFCTMTKQLSYEEKSADLDILTIFQKRDRESALPIYRDRFIEIDNTPHRAIFFIKPV